jgi:hypothetical protein
LNKKFEKAVSRWTSIQDIEKITLQLSQASIYEFMERDEKPNVSPMCSIENLVESTYYFDKKLKYEMCEEICYIRMLACKWKPISGDGNCFYRSVMYSFLENIIFNNDITMIQRIVIDIDEKFDINYENTKILPKENRDVITQLDKRLIITLLKIIFDILDSISSNSKKKKDLTLKALNFLTKSFNFSKSFDIAMILYLRYELYEFILFNKEKKFSEDFPVKIGNLLPSQYETEDGKFLFESFFSKDLLKLYTYAEKIAIYLTPFILKFNLRIIFYDYGKDCNIQSKDFPCFLKNKETLTILYRKAHYDVAYSKEYYNIYHPTIDHFYNMNEKLYVVDEKLIDYYLANQIESVDLLQSKIFNKKEKNRKKELNTDHSVRTSTNTTAVDINKNETLNDIIEITRNEDIKSLMEAEEKLLKELNELDHKNTFKDNNAICPEAAGSLDKNKQENNCSICKNFTSEFNILPCGCFICSKDCGFLYAESFFENFSLNFIKSNFNIIFYLDPFKCLKCMTNFTTIDIMKLSTFIEEKFDLKSYKGILINQIGMICMRCFTQNDKPNKRNRKYKDDIFKSTLKIKHLEHYVCKACSKIKSK